MSNTKKKDKRTKTHEQFMAEVEAQGFADFADVEFTGTYVGAHIPIAFTCPVHGPGQNVRPNILTHKNSNRTHVCGKCGTTAAFKGKPRPGKLTFEGASQRTTERHEGRIRLHPQHESDWRGSKLNGNHQNYTFQCLKGKDHEDWETQGSHVWGQGVTGCPACKDEEHSTMLREKKEEAAKLWFDENTELTLLGLMWQEQANASLPKGFKNALYCDVKYACGHTAPKPILFDDLRAGCRCAQCAEFGYKTNKPGTFYIAEIWRGPELPPIVNIGISNNGWEKRYSVKSRETFVITHSVYCEDGEKPLELEEFLKRELTDYGLNYKGEQLLEDKGVTEMFELSPTQLIGLLQMAHEIGDSHHCSHPEWVAGSTWDNNRRKAA